MCREEAIMTIHDDDLTFDVDEVTYEVAARLAARKPSSARNPGLRRKQPTPESASGGSAGPALDGKVLAFDPVTGKGLVGVNGDMISVDLSRTKLLNKGYTTLRVGQAVQVQPPEDHDRYAISLEAV